MSVSRRISWARSAAARPYRIWTVLAKLKSTPVWGETLFAALPAAHSLAALSHLGLNELAGLPLRMRPRAANPSFYDLVTSSFRAAGVEPLLGAPVSSVHDVLAEIGTARPGWTVLYSSATERMHARRVAFRRLALPSVRTLVVSSPGPATPAVRLLLDACRAVELGSLHHTTSQLSLG